MAGPVLVTRAAAETYMVDRFGSDSFDDLTDPDKDAVLATAERQLSAVYNMPTAIGDMGTDQNTAVYEQALFLAQEPEGVDARAALRAQGVKSAGIVMEVYGGAPGIAICVMAAKLLSADLKADLGKHAAHMDTVTRDENA